MNAQARERARAITTRRSRPSASALPRVRISGGLSRPRKLRLDPKPSSIVPEIGTTVAATAGEIRALKAMQLGISRPTLLAPKRTFPRSSRAATAPRSCSLESQGSARRRRRRSASGQSRRRPEIEPPAAALSERRRQLRKRRIPQGRCLPARRRSTDLNPVQALRQTAQGRLRPAGSSGAAPNPVPLSRTNLSTIFMYENEQQERLFPRLAHDLKHHRAVRSPGIPDDPKYAQPS